MCVSTPKVTMLTFPHMVTAHVVSADNSSGILDLLLLFFPFRINPNPKLGFIWGSVAFN